MAKVISHVIGGSPTEKEASSIGELKAQLGLSNYSAKLNKEPASDDQALEDGDLVTFAQQVKGASYTVVSKTPRTILRRKV